MDLKTATWKLTDFAPGEGVTVGAHGDDFDTANWIPVDVPGDVHRALMAAGRIDDPFYDRNESECAWLEQREWWYRTRFDGPGAAPTPGERLRLVFHGLDTFVTVWLNGEELGRHRNMFREAVFDVTDRIRFGQVNSLALCFDPPLESIGGFGDFKTWGRNEERVFMRKAQFGYGWDWGPRLPTVGIWRPVELRRKTRAVIAGAHCYTLEIAPDRSQALVAVKVEVERFAVDGPLTVDVGLTRGDDAIRARLDLGARDSGTIYLPVKDPALWWTHDLGEPALYALDLTLYAGGDVLDRRTDAVGIRTIALDQSPDPAEPGTRFFRFVLNGVPIFAKGANWIPADSFVGTIADDHYEMLLTAARDGNMNMLRIWGGGIYEHDVFYDLCDRLGILVWQDFMFACAMYPEHNLGFAAEVEAEAEYQVRRLRGHPCLALWCGNNENQWLHDLRNWQTPVAQVPGVLFYHDVLPRVVAEWDGQVPYWPGSPFGGNDHNSMDEGDRHNWDVWHGGFPRKFGEVPRSDRGPEGVSYRRYAEDTGRFISEFGMHASPVLETLVRVIPEDQLFHHSPSMDHHNKDNPKNKGDNLMSTVTGLPGDLDEYVDFSMMAQAEGLKFGIEHFRRRKPHCSGTLFWQLNDCWPVLSWSVLDYYGFGKAGYFYGKRVYAPVLASFNELADGTVELWITNDTLTVIEDTLTVALRTFDDQELLANAVPVLVGPNTGAPVWRRAGDQLGGGPDRYLSVRSAGAVFPTNRHFFTPIKDLVRTPGSVSTSARQVDAHTIEITLTATGYAYFVHLIVPHEGTRFSDNYFDLESGETRQVTVWNPAIALTPDMIDCRSR